jgi:hypothetical protein
MKYFLPLLITWLASFALQNSLQAQSTYAQVYRILNTNCTAAACHDGTVPTFDAKLPIDTFYSTVVNAWPLNPSADSAYYKLIVPGDVQRSFMLRKIAHGISDGLDITLADGNPMPSGLPALPKYEIELMRQWILMGAPDTGTVVDTALIQNYYLNGGIDDTYSPHTAPATGTGCQIYFGRVFLQPGAEAEYSYKYNSLFQSAIEVTGVTTMLPANDFDFSINPFKSGQDGTYPWGLRQQTLGSFASMQYSIGSGAGLTDYTLPEGSAFYYPAGQVFDLDLHVHNPSSDSIYSTDIYINLATQPAGTAQNYMKVANFANPDISIPQDGQPHSFSVTCTDSTITQWNIWKMYSYTHKYGTAFNIYLRNPDGSQGAQVYNGNYDYETGVDVGYYRWGDSVTFRTWQPDSLLLVNSQSGLMGQATYINTAGPDTAVFGLSSSDEMMDVGFFYVPGTYVIPTAINNTPASRLNVMVFPNPAADEFVVSYELMQAEHVLVELYDISGNRVTTLVNNNEQQTGKYTRGFSAASCHLAAGMYFVNFSIGGSTATEKLIITE